MKKRLLLALTLISFIWIPARAQTFSLNLNYQSFRPFIHFGIEIGTRRPAYSPYQSSYLKGYMDGVNGVYYSDYRFYDLVRQIDAYEAGYRDGERDRQLYCRLHGYRRLPRRPFVYDDYYSPRVSVQLWLNNLSFTFLRAPERRLPRYWARRAQPRIRQYRTQFKQQKYFVSAQRTYQRNQNLLKKRGHAIRRKYERNATARRSRSGKPRKLNRKRAMQRVQNHSRTANRSVHSSQANKSRGRQILQKKSGHKSRTATVSAQKVRRKQRSHQQTRRSTKKPDHRRSRNTKRKKQNQPQKKVRPSRSTSKTRQVRKSHQSSRQKTKRGARRNSRSRGGH